MVTVLWIFLVVECVSEKFTICLVYLSSTLFCDMLFGFKFDTLSV
jgi:hypothetical protein